MTLRKTLLAQIREQEEIVQKQGNIIVNLEVQLDQQGSEVTELAHASMEVREEDVGQLTEYKTMNTKLIKFVEKVAASKSRYGREARKLLGI